MRKEFFTEISHQLQFSLFDSLKKQKTKRFRNHKHTEPEIGFIIEGMGNYVLDGESFDVGPGDIIFVRTNEQHCIPKLYTSELRAFNIHLSPFYLWNTCAEYIDTSKIRALVTADSSINHLITDDSLKSKLNEIRVLFASESKNVRFELKKKILELMIELVKHIPDQADETGEISRAAARMNDIQAALDYIDRNIANPITLDDIARAASMSRSYLSSVFKLVTGVAPYDYLLVARIEKASEMLRFSEMPILDVATKCGFGSLASFNKSFKKNMGMTPRDYRLSHRK